MIVTALLLAAAQTAPAPVLPATTTAPASRLNLDTPVEAIVAGSTPPRLPAHVRR